jgi:hypothetical protein
MGSGVPPPVYRYKSAVGGDAHFMYWPKPTANSCLLGITVHGFVCGEALISNSGQTKEKSNNTSWPRDSRPWSWPVTRMQALEKKNRFYRSKKITDRS